MRWEQYVNAEEVTKTINVLKPDHQLFEIRVLGADKRKVLSGYFTDSTTLINAFDNISLRDANIYITLNSINESLYSRIQHDKFVANVNTTSDKEITFYDWLFIDLDPTRPTNISSSAEELAEAEKLAKKIKEFLGNLKFEEPIEALSGNGYHLLYKIKLKNSEESTLLIADCLATLSALFSTDEVKVDVTNCNPARICKLHGTLAQKGADTESRPHRMSRLVYVPDVLKVNNKGKLQKLVDELPEEIRRPKKMTSKTNRNSDFNIVDFMEKHGITYVEKMGTEGPVYHLDHCPFDHSHMHGDARIFSYSNGAVAFKCHHNSCQKYKWQDVRELFEPGVYGSKIEDDGHIDEGWLQHKKLVKHEEQEIKPDYVFPNLTRACDLEEKDIPELKVFVGVDDEVPFLVEGTCILSAKSKLGKSWLSLELCDAITKGNDFLGYKTFKCSALYFDLETGDKVRQNRLRKLTKIVGKREPNFYIVDEALQLKSGFEEQVEHYLKEDPDIGVIVIDVFTKIVKPKTKDISDYEYYYNIISILNGLSRRYHLSIILVCHDRKVVDPSDPFSNILGSTALQGATDQMAVMFKRKYDDPVTHIAVKGRTIDGIVDIDATMQEGLWVKADNVLEIKKRDEYKKTDIYLGVMELMKINTSWKGSCSGFANECEKLGVPIEVPLDKNGEKDFRIIGKTFNDESFGEILKEKNITIEVVKNGAGAKTYKLTVDNRWCTVDEEDEEYVIPF